MTQIKHGAASGERVDRALGFDTDDSFLRLLRALAAEHAIRPSPPAPSSGPELVRDVMVTGVVAAHEGAQFKEILAALQRNRISAVPVIDPERRVVGVVSLGDLLARLAHLGPRRPRGHALDTHSERLHKMHATTASQLMTSPAVVVRPETPITSAAWEAARRRVTHLPVVDTAGVLVGIVSRGDLLRTFLRPDEEIRADIIENVVHGTFILDREQVDVTVTEGVVTLRGQLPTQTMAEDLAEIVRGLAGVVDVRSDALTYRH